MLHLHVTFIHAVNWVKATGACFCNSSLEYGILDTNAFDEWYEQQKY